jgi:hypothetical protein
MRTKFIAMSMIFGIAKRLRHWPSSATDWWLCVRYALIIIKENQSFYTLMQIKVSENFCCKKKVLSQKFDTKNCFTNFENKCFLFYTTKKLTLIDPCFNLVFLKILSEMSVSLLLSLLLLKYRMIAKN